MHRLLEQQNPFRTAEARRAGINARSLLKMVERGDLIPLGRGLYLPAQSDLDPDLAEITTKAPDATMCLTSALAHHGLIDDIPTSIDMALSRGLHRPTTQAPTTWHSFDADTFRIGRERDTIRGVSIHIYSPERCIADAFRLRGFAGYETATTAMKSWLSARGNSPSTLLDMAHQLPRTEGPLRSTLEAII